MGVAAEGQCGREMSLPPHNFFLGPPGKLGLPTTARGLEYVDFIRLFTWRGTEASAQFAARFATDVRIKALEGRHLRAGGGSTSFHASQMEGWWTWRANNVGIPQANAELDAYLDATELEVIEALWLYGIVVQKRILLTEDIELVPVSEMPFSWHRAWIEKQQPIGLGFATAAPRSALTIRLREPKILSLTDGDFSASGEAQSRLQQVALLLNAMPGACSFGAMQSTYMPDHTPMGIFGGDGGGMPIHDVIPYAATLFQPYPGVDMQTLLGRFAAKSASEQARLSRALYRLGQAKGRRNEHDRVLDLGIALEMLLLNDSPAEQLSLTFRLRGAWLMGESPQERRAIHDDLKETYRLRSKVAHEGFDKSLAFRPKPSDAEARLRRMRLAEQIVRKLILVDQPNWAAIVLGDQTAMGSP